MLGKKLVVRLGFIVMFISVILIGLPGQGRAKETSQGKPISHADMVKQATQQSAAKHQIELLVDGRARIPSPLQGIEAMAAPDGVTILSTQKDEPGSFTIRPVSLGRAKEHPEPMLSGKVTAYKDRVSIIRGNMIEELTTSADGVRQDFVIQTAPKGEGEIVLDLTFEGAKLHEKGDGARVTMQQGRELLYHHLLVTDSTGKQLPARFDLHNGGHLRIVVADAGAIYPVRIDPTVTDADWVSIALPDTNNTVRAIVSDGINIYVAGDFTSIGGIAANRIAKWNGSAWSTLGAGFGTTVRALAWDGTNLYAGGGFATVGDVNVNGIAKWNGSTWTPLGSGTNGTVYVLAWDGTNLYAGGYFTTAGGVSVNNIAKWNGSTWSTLGSGVNTAVYALASDGTNLYAGGYFTTAGGVSANYIAKWNGSEWSALGSGVNGTVNALAWSGLNLYVGGQFTTAGGAVASRIAVWSGSTWSPVGTGMTSINSCVYTLAWYDGKLYAGGFFTKAGGVSTNNIAVWNGYTWSAPGIGVNSNAYALAVEGTNLYAGGQFATAGAVSANYIAKWNGSTWSALGSGISNVFVLAWDGGNLYAGGSFTKTGDVNANYIAKWNGSSWSPLGTGMDNNVYALVWDGANLYAGGSFTTAGGVSAAFIAKWNGSAWSSVGTGMNSVVYALASDGKNLYAGGYFTSAGEASANYLAKWDGSAWSALGTGMNSSVNELIWSGANLYAGGNFTTAGTASANHVAQWNGSAWSALGAGLDGDVSALAWDGTNLYTGGSFTTAGGVSANHVAQWNGSAWSALGTGMNSYVSALAWDGANLYAGGFFVTAGGVNTNNIAIWNGSAWSALGTGMKDGAVSAFAWDGNNLYAAGSFVQAGMNPARVAYFPIAHTVTTTAEANGGISPTTAMVHHGETATFAVTPNSGYSVATVDSTCGTGLLSGSTYTTAPVVNDCTVTASFIPIIQSLSISVTGTGTVHTSPGTDLACTSSCVTSYNDNTLVTLTASTDSGSVFMGWGGACTGTNPTCAITMDAAKNVTANFAAITPITSVTLNSDKATPSYPGAVITFTADASGGNGTPEYKFRVRDTATGIWTTMQGYATANTWTWTPSGLGTFDIQVQARNVGSGVTYQAVRSLTFTIGANAVTSVTLVGSKASPVIPGSVIFTATAKGGDGNYEYKFRVKDNSTGIWTTMQGYGPLNTWTWNASTVGSYDIQVQARIKGSGVTYQAFKTVTYSVVASLITSVDLTANASSPAPLATVGTVGFTAQAHGGSGSYQYKFRIRPTGTTTWTLTQSYSSNNTWDWTPTAAGSFDIQVMTRTVGSTAAYEQAKIVTFSISP